MSCLLWLILTLLTTAVMSFFSTQEMACVSFNKLRLQYLVSQKNSRALWLHKMLQKPTHLFGTTLIGVNLFLMISSECGRKFYGSLGVPEDLSPLTQAPLILIIGELAPMFAARWCAEKVAIWGAPILYFSSCLLKPLLNMIDLLSEGFNHLFSNKNIDRTEEIMIREELQKILEQSEESTEQAHEDFDNAIIANIFNLRLKRAVQVMQPLNALKTASWRSTVKEVRTLIQEADQDFVPIWHKHPQQIVGIAYMHDLIHAPDHRKMADISSSCWYVTELSPLLDLVDDFRRHEMPSAVVLNDKGEAIGILSFEDLTEEILFYRFYRKDNQVDRMQIHFHEKTLPGDTSLEEFQSSFGLDWKESDCTTLADLVEKKLGRKPNGGDYISIDSYEIVVKETGLLGAKLLTIKTKHWN